MTHDEFCDLGRALDAEINAEVARCGGDRGCGVDVEIFAAVVPGVVGAFVEERMRGRFSDEECSEFKARAWHVLARAIESAREIGATVH